MIRFQDSNHWLLKFKKSHRIVSRKINKFVTKQSTENKNDLHNKEINFVKDIKQLMNQVSADNTYNSDESGFQLEMHSDRRLATEKERKAQYLVHSNIIDVGSITISSTVTVIMKKI